MNRRLALVLVLALLVLVLTACGKEQADHTGQLQDQTTDGIDDSADSSYDEYLEDDTLKEDVQDLGDDLKDDARDLGNDLEDGARDLEDGLADGVRDATDAAEDLLNDGSRAIQSAAGGDEAARGRPLL